MKILFLYNKIDNTLRDRVKRVREHGAVADMLSLVEFKLHQEEETKIIDIESKLDSYEDRSKKLRTLNRIFKRKKLLRELDNYDLIDIYKNERSCIFIQNEIIDRSAHYFITPSSEESNDSFLYRSLSKTIFKNSSAIICSNDRVYNRYKKDFQKITHLIREPINLFEEIDKIDEKNIFKAAYAMGIDFEKDVVYCDMSGEIGRQLSLIEDLNDMPKEQKRRFTFIIHLNNHSFFEREKIKKLLNEINFDYLLIDSLITPPQSALLYKLSNISIILSSDSPTNALANSLYSNNLIYLYKDTNLEDLYQKSGFFMESFNHFLTKEDKMNPIIDDLLYKNRKTIYEIFYPEEVIKRYIEVIKDL
jgi:hypothetical protein